MLDTDRLLSKSLRKARQDALSAKTFTPCVSCLAYGHRCTMTRPCSKCIKTSRKCTRSEPKTDILDAERRMLIEHPPAFTNTHIDMISENIRINPVCSVEWAREAILRQRRIGFYVNDTIQSLSSVPAIHHYAISASLATAKTRTSLLVSALGSKGRIPSDSRTSQLETSLEVGNDDIIEKFTVRDDVGFMSVIFDPITGCRRSVVANAQMASIPNISRSTTRTRSLST